MLLLDAGNSSLKCLNLATGERKRFDWRQDWLWSAVDDWFQQQDGQRAWLASVAGQALTSRVQASWDALHPDRPMRRLTTPARLDGLYNAYEQPGQLGVDRWLALLGAWSQTQGDAVIIDAGSAITLDLMSRSRGHLGGAILPGLACDPLRFQRMFPQIDFTDAELRCPEQPGRSTFECLCPLAPAKVPGWLAERLASWLALLEPTVEVLLCGEDARRLAEALPLPSRIEPDLVFAGMRRQIELNPDGVPG